MSTMSEDRGAAALLSPASDGPTQPTRAERPGLVDYKYSDPKKTTNGSRSSKAADPAKTSVAEFLDRLLSSRLLSGEDVDRFLTSQPGLLEGDTASLVGAFVGHGLLTEYQVARLLAGQLFGLVLDKYRMVERLGSGGMGVVYKAEHLHMKRVVAIEVLVTKEERNSVYLQRFYSEIQATAVLSHPNIVLAFDAGEMAVPNSPDETLRYLVMEYVPGKNFEQHILDHGPLPIAEACEYIRQAASGLQHAYEHGLVHRDIKPSNLILTPHKQVKILDFGLARLSRRRHTEAHAMLGSVDYMAPEQARDARSVDIRADIYGLGGTLYWLLTAQKPFPGERPVIEELFARQRELPLPLQQARPDIPTQLEKLVCQMMALEPGGRYPTPAAVMSALNAFLKQTSSSRMTASSIAGDEHGSTDPALKAVEEACSSVASTNRSQRGLIVSPSAKTRQLFRKALEAQALECSEAHNAEECRARLLQCSPALLVVDARLSRETALQICSELRAQPPGPHLKLI